MSTAPEMMPMRIVTVDPQQLGRLIRDAVADALAERDAQSNRPLSAVAAARVAKTRTQVVLDALATGALPGRREGRAWRIAPSDIHTWAINGRPTQIDGAS